MMPWKEALLTALKGRSHRDFFRAAFVAAPVTVLGSFEKGIGTGLMLGLWVGLAVFLIDIVEDARLSRKRARLEASRVSD
jgi:hypothetical protein